MQFAEFVVIGGAVWYQLHTRFWRPPDDFASAPLLTDRGALFLALDTELEALDGQANELMRRRARIVGVTEECLRSGNA